MKIKLIGIIICMILIGSGLTVSGNISLERTSILTYNNGSLSGYVYDNLMNPIEGARVRVYFHETFEEDYTDSSGYYRVSSIPICYCLKNCTALKVGYSSEWVLLAIDENTTYDFILMANHPPDKPTIFGEVEGKIGKEYKYIFNASDPDGDDIWYHICWGDKEIIYIYGPYKSGQPIILSYIWTREGPSAIQCKARDVYDAETDWTYLEVTMSKNKHFIFNFTLLSWLFERFPNVFPILRYIVGL